MVVAAPHHGGVGAALPAAVLRLPGDVPDQGLLPAPALRAAVTRGRPGGQQAVDGARVAIPDGVSHVNIDTCCTDLPVAGTRVTRPDLAPVVVTLPAAVLGGSEDCSVPGLGASSTRLAAVSRGAPGGQHAVHGTGLGAARSDLGPADVALAAAVLGRGLHCPDPGLGASTTAHAALATSSPGGQHAVHRIIWVALSLYYENIFKNIL